MKKILVITYYWPPAGGVSVLRTLKIVKYLAEFGWTPIVYAPSNALYPYLDHNNLNDIPENIQIIKRPIREPFRIFKFLTGRKKTESLDSILQVRRKKFKLIENLGIWIRGNFFIPDARFLWINPSVRYLTKLLKKNKVDAIFSDGPPHTNTVIACKLSQKLGIPWLSDFQDPWTQADYFRMFNMGKRALKSHRKLEEECIKTAKKIIIASPTWKKDLELIGARNVDVIYYGYDESDFKKYDEITPSDNKLIIFHAGLIGVDRLPLTFLRLLRELVEQYPAISEKLSLQLAGQVDYEIKRAISEYKLSQYVEYVGFIERKKVIERYFKSHLLLLLLNKAFNEKGRLPGKLYEYLRSGRPILALGNPEGDAGRILEETNAGICLDYDNQKDIRGFMIKVLNDADYKQTVNWTAIKQYSNYNQTKKIAGYLDNIIKTDQ